MKKILDDCDFELTLKIDDQTQARIEQELRKALDDYSKSKRQKVFSFKIKY